MEQFIDILLDKGLAFLLMGVIIYFQWKENKDLKTDNKKSNTYILEREKEIASKRLDEQKETISALNNVATALSNHNKTIEYEQRKKDN